MIYLELALLSIVFYFITFVVTNGTSGIKAKPKNKLFSIKNLFGLLLAFVLAFIFNYLALPKTSYQFLSFWVALLVYSGIAMGCFWLVNYQQIDQQINNEERNFVVLGMTCVSIFIAVFVIGGFYSTPLFHAKTYAHLIKIQKMGKKNNNLQLVNQQKALKVTTNLAAKRSAELIGNSNKEGLASRVDFGTYYGSIVNGQPMWLAPLTNSSFFTWLFNGSTPGYFEVSQTNSNKAKLVENQPITTGSKGFYFDGLHRVLYQAGYTNYGYGEAMFQIDNKGNPYYVVPLMRHMALFGASKPVAWALVNAKTQKVQQFNKVSQLPSWVNRVYPMSFIYQAINNWGCYKEGFWTCTLSKINVISPTKGINVTLAHNGHNMIYYTGMQYAKKNHGSSTQSATSGVMTVDTRTGQASFYRRSGITETAAQNVMNGAVSNYNGWKASNPVLINVNGLQTYFSVITDNSGSRKGYGMVWQNNRNVYGIGSNISEAMRSYMGSYRQNASQQAFNANTNVNAIKYKGKISVVRAVVNNNKTSFYIRLANNNHKIFVYSPSNPAKIASTQKGDKVVIKVYNNKPGVINVTSFKNLSLDLKQSKQQKQLNKQTKKIDQKEKIKH